MPAPKTKPSAPNVITKKISKRNISKSPELVVRNSIEFQDNYDEPSFGDPTPKLI